MVGSPWLVSATHSYSELVNLLAPFFAGGPGPAGSASQSADGEGRGAGEGRLACTPTSLRWAPGNPQSPCTRRGEGAGAERGAALAKSRAEARRGDGGRLDWICRRR